MAPAELRQAYDTLAVEAVAAVPGVKLDARAGVAAQLWFTPARKGPDGRPAPVRQWKGAPVDVDNLLMRVPTSGGSGGSGDHDGGDADADALASLPRSRVEGLTVADIVPALERLPAVGYDEWRDTIFEIRHQFADTPDDDDAFAALTAWSSGELHRALATREPKHATARDWADGAAAKFDEGRLRTIWEDSAGDARPGARTIRGLFHRARLPLPAHAIVRDGAHPEGGGGGEFVAPVVVDLCDLFAAQVQPPAPKFVLDAIVPAGVVTLLAGHGGTGKTSLALALALHLASGRAWAGREVPHACRVLFFSGEDAGTVARWRLWHAASAYGIGASEFIDRLQVIDASDADAILYERNRDGCRATRAFDWLARVAVEFSADVVVVDNASEAFAGDEVGRADVRGFMRTLRQLRPGITVVLIAHVDKATAKAGKGGEGYSGSTAWHNSARSRLLLRSDGAHLVLEHQKGNFGPLSPPIALRWQGPVPVPLTEAAQIEADDQTLRVVVRLIAECTERGDFVSTATNSTAAAWPRLKHAPDLPPGTDRARLDDILREGERRGLLARREYRDSYRNVRQRWDVTPEGAALIEPAPRE